MHSKSELIRVLRVEFFIKFYQQCLGYFEKGGISHVRPLAFHKMFGLNKNILSFELAQRSHWRKGGNLLEDTEFRPKFWR